MEKMAQICDLTNLKIIMLLRSLMRKMKEKENDIANQDLKALFKCKEKERKT